MTEMQIYLLGEKPELAETCAAWSYGEWGCHYPDSSLKKSLDRYKQTVVKSGTSLPKTWIGLLKDKIVGMISLKENDHPDLTHLKPWLASMFIHPEFRRNGYASLLITHLHTEAKQLGYKALYLYTPNAEKLYERHGWKIIDEVRDPRGLHDHEKLMEKVL